MADFYDEMFPEPPTFEEVVFDYIADSHRCWNPIFIPQKVAEHFGIPLLDAENMVKFWRKINKRD